MVQKKSKVHIPAEQKIAIVKSYLMDQTSVASLSEAHGVSPSAIFGWTNQLFLNGAVVFERKNDKKVGHVAASKAEKKIEELEQKLQRKNEVVSEVTEELVKLKKLNGAI